jgi:hypothetical protein
MVISILLILVLILGGLGGIAGHSSPGITDGGMDYNTFTEYIL